MTLQTQLYNYFTSTYITLLKHPTPNPLCKSPFKGDLEGLFPPLQVAL